MPIDTVAVQQEDIKQARAWAEEHHFDTLVSTDGDADRPLIADEHGEFLRAKNKAKKLLSSVINCIKEYLLSIA